MIAHLTSWHKTTTPTSGDSVPAFVKNYQIYALVAVLLEIAIRKSIDTSTICSEISAELKEYFAMMQLDKERVASQALWFHYGDVVSRCLPSKIDTQTYDLANIELQREFYESVVCQLEGCLRIMVGWASSETDFGASQSISSLATIWTSLVY